MFYTESSRLSAIAMSLVLGIFKAKFAAYTLLIEPYPTTKNPNFLLASNNFSSAFPSNHAFVILF